MSRVPKVRAIELADRYDGFLIDAYGVLVTSGGPLPGAADFVSELANRGILYAVVTNDASRSRRSCRESLLEKGIDVAADRFVTSGSLLARWFDGRQGIRTSVLGPEDSVAYAVEAGCEVVDLGDDPDAVVLADEAGYPFVATLDLLLSHVLRRARGGDPVELVLPNPDLMYPKSGDGFGIASGGIAQMLESLWDHALGSGKVRFERLGKPQPAIYEAGVELVGTRNVVMLGDQLATDIAGAVAFGIDSALVEGGVGGAAVDGVEPTYRVVTLME